MHAIHDFDQDCRYLAVLPSVHGMFESRLGALGVHLPSGLSLVDLVRYGLVKPAMIVRLPDELFTTWEDFPVLSGECDESAAWALRLWRSYVTPERGWGDDRDSLPDDWYCHPFDRNHHPFGQEVRRHAVDPSECDWDQKVELPSGERISPWAVFFPYWHAYLIAELLQALPLFQPILNVPDAKAFIWRAFNDYDQLKSVSDTWVGTVQGHWRQAASAFDWLSRFRSLRPVASALRIPYWEWGQAAARILSDLGMSADSVKTSFRDELLLAWQRWQWFLKDSLPAACHEGLREEIDLAFEFMETALNEDLDPEDAFWNPPDPNPRRWARLPTALPREDWNSLRKFCQLSPLYLADFKRVMPQNGAPEPSQLRRAARSGWARSVAFRRFCLAFSRLDEHYTGFPLSPVGPDLRAHTPIDYLLLCSLFIEKWLGEVAEATGTKASTFKGRAELVCGVVVGGLSVPVDVTIARYRALRESGRRTDFRSPTMNRSDPFVSLRELAPGDVAGYVASCFLNCEIMRNYAAHRDQLDWELINGGLAMMPLQSMLSLLQLWLAQLPTK